MSSIIRWRSGVMTRSVAEEKGAETALILAQQGRRVSEVKWMIGERGERLSGARAKGTRRTGRRPRLHEFTAERFSSNGIIHLDSVKISDCPVHTRLSTCHHVAHRAGRLRRAVPARGGSRPPVPDLPSAGYLLRRSRREIGVV